MATYQFLARGTNREILGALSGVTLDATLTFDQVGSLEITVPAEKCPRGWPAFTTDAAGNALLEPFGLIVLRDGAVWASGTIDENTDDWSADPTSDDAGAGKYTFTFDTDLARIGYAVVYPDPARSWAAQKTDQATGTQYKFTGNAETALRNLVDLNAGPNALAARQPAGVALGPVAGVGTSVTVAERFTPLLDALRKYAQAGGGLGFDVVDNLAGELLFTVYQPTDRSASVRFAPELGNLSEMHTTYTAPTGTVALVAGGGQGTSRTTYEQSGDDAAVWGRRELFLDQRQTTDATELAQAATDALQQAAAQGSLSAVAVDSDVCRYGTHYNLGDTCTVSRRGRPYTDVVSSVHVQVDDNGVETVTTTIGAVDTTSQTYAQLRELLARIQYLEAAP